MAKLAVSIREATHMIGVSRSSIYILFRDGKLTPRKSGKRTLVLVRDLEHYVEALPAANPPCTLAPQ